MSIHIHDLYDYLDVHPARDYADSAMPLLEMLHDVYTMHNSIDNEKIRSMFRQLHGIMDLLPEECVDQLFAMICDLCMEHEALAFSHGVAVGMQLMSEIRLLP